MQWPGRQNSVSIILLAFSLLLPAWLRPQASQSPSNEHRAGTTGAITIAYSTGSESSEENPPGPGPEARPYFFLQLFAVLGSGLVISAAHLAHKFRRFWGLGVFANPFGILYMAVGAAVCGVPVILESRLNPNPHPGSPGPWIADLTGVILVLILPVIRLGRAERPPEDGQLRGFESASSNPIVALIEDGIRDRILKRMRTEVSAISSQYDWETIRNAGNRALAEEAAVRPMEHAREGALRDEIENLQPGADPKSDSRKKNEALTRMIGWCSFRRLKAGLEAARESTGAPAPAESHDRLPSLNVEGAEVPALGNTPDLASRSPSTETPLESEEPDKVRNKTETAGTDRRRLAVAAVVAVTAAMLAWMGAAAYGSHQAVKHFNRAHDLLGEGNNDAAAVEFRKAFALKPNYAAAYRGLGIALYNEGKYNDAVAEFRKSISLDPNSVNAHLDLGLALDRAGQSDAAVAEYQKAIALDPNKATAHRYLADVLGDSGQYDRAIAEYQSAIALDPNDANAHFFLGDAFTKKQLYDAATTEYQKAISLAPSNARAHANLGTALDREGLHDAAVAEFQKAIALDPKDAYAHVMLGGALYHENKNKAAFAEYRAGISLEPKNAYAYVLFGKVLDETGDHEDALAEYRAAVAADPNNVYAHRTLGDALGDAGDHENATEEYKRAISLDPNNEVIHYNLGNEFAATGQYDAAIGEYQQAVSLDPKDAAAYNNLGLALIEKGQRDEAIADLRQSISLDPENAQAHNNLGVALEDRGKYRAAIAEFKDAIRLDPSYTNAHNNLTRVLREARRK